jgi:hypothetical protein
MLKDTFFPKVENMTLSGMEGDIKVASYVAGGTVRPVARPDAVGKSVFEGGNFLNLAIGPLGFVIFI